MRTSLVFTWVVIFFFTILADKATADDYKLVIQKACSSAPHNTLCLESLGDADKTGGTDLGGVLCVAVNLVYKNLTDTQDYAKTIHQSMKAGFVAQTVFDCTSTYEDAVAQTKEAVTACEKKTYTHVKGYLLAAMADPKICEDKFTIYPGTVSPLTSRNEVLLQLYGNALAITDLVNGVKR